MIESTRSPFQIDRKIVLKCIYKDSSLLSFSNSYELFLSPISPVTLSQPFCPLLLRLPLPHLTSLKREIRKLAQEECGYEEPTVAMAFVYFEKLVLQGKLNKQNRKLCAGACVLLAAKIGGDLKKHEVKLLIDVSFLPTSLA